MASLLSSSSSPSSSSSSALFSFTSSLSASSHSTAGHVQPTNSSVTAAVALVVAGSAAFFIIACCCLIFQLARPLRLDQHQQHSPRAWYSRASSAHSQLLQLAHLQLFNRTPPPPSAVRERQSAAVEPVGLTPEQLDALPSNVWQTSDGRQDDGERERCSICLEEYEDSTSVVTKVRCGHVYHRECIRQWLSHNPTCPLCLTTLAYG